MTAARKPSAASIERALVEWHEAIDAARETCPDEDQWRRLLMAGDAAESKLLRIAARLAGSRRKVK